jgi:hypothetical protein
LDKLARASIGSAATVTAPSPRAIPAASGVAPGVPAAQQTALLKAALAQVGSYLNGHGQSLELSVDAQSYHPVVIVRDTQTGAVIRQMPSAELLRIADALGTNSNALIDLTA